MFKHEQDQVAKKASFAIFKTAHMLRQLLVGGIVSLGNIAVHAMVMTLVVTVVRRVGGWERRESSLWLAAIMAGKQRASLPPKSRETWRASCGTLHAARCAGGALR